MSRVLIGNVKTPLVNNLNETVAGKKALDAAIGATIKKLIADAILESDKKKYPVGKLIMTTNSANPSTYIGFGTWAAWGQGRVPIGVGSNGTTTYAANATGGSESVSHTHAASTTGASSVANTGSTVLTVANLPKHTHTMAIYATNKESAGYGLTPCTGFKDRAVVTGTKATLTTSSTGSATGHVHTMAHTHTTPALTASIKVVQPYATCYMWRRTA